MAYETKVILSMVYDIISTSKTLEEAGERVAKIANVEGLILTNPKESEDKKPNENM